MCSKAFLWLCEMLANVEGHVSKPSNVNGLGISVDLLVTLFASICVFLWMPVKSSCEVNMNKSCLESSALWPFPFSVP